MRLQCKIGPGCYNHDWYRTSSSNSHTRFSHHGSSISQPVGGGYQIAFRTPKPRSAKKITCKPTPCTPVRNVKIAKSVSRTVTRKQSCDSGPY